MSRVELTTASLVALTTDPIGEKNESRKMTSLGHLIFKQKCVIVCE